MILQRYLKGDASADAGQEAYTLDGDDPDYEAPPSLSELGDDSAHQDQFKDLVTPEQIAEHEKETPEDLPGDELPGAPDGPIPEPKEPAKPTEGVGAKRHGLIVPYTRQLKRGVVGIDVLATKRALSHAGLRRWGVGFTNRAGGRWVKDVQRFQRRHGLKADGVYGPATHRKLAPYFDRYGAELMSKEKKRLSNLPTGKAGAVHAAILLYNHPRQDHYTNGPARMTIVRSRVKDLWAWYKRGRQIAEDCSSSSTGFFFIGGLPDPNHLGYNGQGYTGTLAVHGVRVSRPAPGDLAFYGSGWPYHHVSIYVGGGKTVSFGRWPPSLISPYWPGFSHFRRY